MNHIQPNSFKRHLIFLSECCVTDLELQSLKDKTHRQLRLRELLLENSSQSTLVVMYVFDIMHLYK